MSTMIKEHGKTILAVFAILLLIGMVTPIGEIVYGSLTEIVTKFTSIAGEVMDTIDTSSLLGTIQGTVNP